MELRQLRYFAVLAEELHFGRAAERLHISQPPLSVQIRRLEDNLGVQLLNRSTRHVELTAAGEELRGRLAQLLPMLDEAMLGLSEVHEGMRGSLVVSFVSSANYTLLPGAVRRFREQRPNVALRFLPLASAEQIERVQEGQVEIAIVRDPPPSTQFDSIPLRSEGLVVCVPADHELAREQRVAPERLRGIPRIIYPRHLMPGFVDVVHAAMAPARSSGVHTHKVVHQETALGFVAAGEGITILPESVREQLPASLRAIDLETPVRSETAAVLPSIAAASAAAGVFMDALCEVAGVADWRA